MFRTIAQGINFDKYDEIPVEVTGHGTMPQPIRSFEDANLYEPFMENVRKAKYSKPTPVQKYSIPIVLAGRDLMACAQTGSGKTVSNLSFVCKMVIYCKNRCFRRIHSDQ